MKIENVQALYPNPVRYTRKRYEEGRCYCVGGAVMMALGIDERFPDGWDLSGALYPRGRDEGRRFRVMGKCNELVKENDAGHFDKAWAIAAELIKPIRRKPARMGE